MKPHPIQCTCGAVRGFIAAGARVNHCLCYCRDCQAFAHFLGRADEILDAAGGTAIVQTQPRHLRFTQGGDRLACVRLTLKGPLRWYTDCCHTPIGNSLATARLPFIGLVHTCLEGARQTLEQAFGPVRMVVHTASAKGSPKPKPAGLAAGLLRVMCGILASRLTGTYRQNPFFDVSEDRPVATPLELTDAERVDLYRKV